MEERIIRSAHVVLDGDRSVGLGSESVVIRGDGDFLFDTGVIADEDRKEMVESFRRKLADAFSEVWDGRPAVMFDYELEAEREEEMKMLDILDQQKEA